MLPPKLVIASLPYTLHNVQAIPRQRNFAHNLFFQHNSCQTLWVACQLPIARPPSSWWSGCSRLVGGRFNNKPRNLHWWPQKRISSPAHQNLKGLHRSLNWVQPRIPSRGVNSTLPFRHCIFELRALFLACSSLTRCFRGF